MKRPDLSALFASLVFGISLLGLAVLAVAQLNLEHPEAKAKLEFTVTPQVAMPPVDVKLRIWVERDACNRQLLVTLDSGAFARASVIQLDGDKAPRYHEVRYPALPGGQYQVDVAVTDCRGKIAAHATRTVLYATPDPVGDDEPVVDNRTTVVVRAGVGRESDPGLLHALGGSRPGRGLRAWVLPRGRGRAGADESARAADLCG